MLVEIDAIVERLVTDLEQRGLLQETLIIFSSDNGGQRLIGEQNKGHFAVGGFRGDKGTIYEGGHRVPLIVKWGQQAFGSSPLPAGSASDALVGIQDLFATLAEMTGVPLAGDQGRDSVSLLPVLMGERQQRAIRWFKKQMRQKITHRMELRGGTSPTAARTGSLY